MIKKLCHLIFSDRTFYKTMLAITIPVALQGFFNGGMIFVDTWLLSSLNENAVAAVGLSGQVLFILNILMVGVATGSSIFIAQYWGKQETHAIRRVVGLSLILALILGLIFMLICLFIPAQVLGLYTPDPALIAIGVQYLSIIAVACVLNALNYVLISALRCVEIVKLPSALDICGMILKAALSFILIFGALGINGMGVTGAALATVIASAAKLLVLLLLIYLKKMPIALRLHDFLTINKGFIIFFAKITAPVMLTELFWSLGRTMFSVIFSRINTQAIAAYNLISPLENIIYAVFFGMSSACAIMVGMQVGAGEQDKAQRYATRFLALGVLGAVVMGGVTVLLAPLVIRLYPVSAAVSQIAADMMTMFGLTFWYRVPAMFLIMGILRAGGDTMVGMLIDAGFIWVFGVGLGALGAFVFHLPPHWVFLLLISDELFKVIAAGWRFISRKWMRNVTVVPALPELETLPETSSGI